MGSNRVYPRDFEQKIGFAVIREQIGALALSEKGREGVMMSQFSSDTFQAFNTV